MPCNVGKTEQVVRIAVGISILLAGLCSKKWWGVLGNAPIITGATRYCPANTILGIDNCMSRVEE